MATIERNGVDRVPEDERTSTPWTFFTLFVGTSVGLGAVAFGWVGLTFGLGLRDTVLAIAAGTAVGQILLIPLTLIGSGRRRTTPPPPGRPSASGVG